MVKFEFNIDFEIKNWRLTIQQAEKENSSHMITSEVIIIKSEVNSSEKVVL